MDQQRHNDTQRENNPRPWKRHAVTVLIAALAGAVIYWYPGRISHQQSDTSGKVNPREPEAPAAAPESPPKPGTDRITAEAPPPLPPLAESDMPFFAALGALFDTNILNRFVLPEHLIERLVATIDSLDGKAIPPRFRPLGPIPGPPLIAGEGDHLIWDPANAARYTPLIEAFTAAESTALVKLYRDHYPWFQQAYIELGYPGRSFNDRLIEIIDHLLATPEYPGPFRLVRPKVLYQFADDTLETLSWGQKTLLRIGPENRRLIAQRLAELKTELRKL